MDLLDSKVHLNLDMQVSSTCTILNCITRVHVICLCYMFNDYVLMCIVVIVLLCTSYVYTCKDHVILKFKRTSLLKMGAKTYSDCIFHKVGSSCKVGHRNTNDRVTMQPKDKTRTRNTRNYDYKHIRVIMICYEIIFIVNSYNTDNSILMLTTTLTKTCNFEICRRTVCICEYVNIKYVGQLGIYTEQVLHFGHL